MSRTETGICTGNVPQATCLLAPNGNQMDDADFVGESDGDTEEETPEPLLPPPEQQQVLHTPPQQLDLDDDVMRAILSPVVLSEPSGLAPSSSPADDGGMSERPEQDTALDTSTDGMQDELAEVFVEERHISGQLVFQDVAMTAQDGRREPVAMDADQVDQAPAVFSEGDLVEVQSRTWPGINKPGGSGRIVRVHQETDENGRPVAVYDVRYVLGGLERRIEREYVELSSILQERADARKPVGRIFYHGELHFALEEWTLDLNFDKLGHVVQMNMLRTSKGEPEKCVRLLQVAHMRQGA